MPGPLAQPDTHRVSFPLRHHFPIINQHSHARIVVLNLINISKKPASQIRIEGIATSALQLVQAPAYCTVDGVVIKLEDAVLEPFSVKTIKLTLRPAKPGIIEICPSVTYTDNQGQLRVNQLKTIALTVNPTPSDPKATPHGINVQSEIELSLVLSVKTFDYLVSSFKEDYLRKKLPLERSGWRTLMDIVKEAGVSRYSVYGTSGNRGARRRLI